MRSYNEISCKECSKVYIEETGRYIGIQQKEPMGVSTVYQPQTFSLDPSYQGPEKII
jgi:hypothetical protein